MHITPNKLLANLMTAQDIAETYEKLNRVGPEGSKLRDMAFALLTLSDSIREATIPNQQFYFETANLEQFYLHFTAFKETHGIDGKKVRDGLKWIKDTGLLESSFNIPDDLDALAKRAVNAVRLRADIEKQKQDEHKLDGANGAKKNWN